MGAIVKIQPGMLFMLFVETIKSLDNAQLMADWIEDNNPTHPEAQLYIDRLRHWKTVKISDLTESVAKFGCKKSRRLIRRLMRRKTKHLGGSSRKTHQMVMRKQPANMQGQVWKGLYVVGSYG